ncbi:RELA isoform 14 [Pongo abelii]|uniref:RELA isoform 14 n=1 Tax=Pongo abelii TaxID=9601 RepID=A0A2J8TZI9_PONAB|nr:RELA isoform 14 [Pongo abelii]
MDELFPLIFPADQWLHRTRDSTHLPGHQGPSSPASPPRACRKGLPGWLL